mgnify:CR=1 FL=1
MKRLEQDLDQQFARLPKATILQVDDVLINRILITGLQDGYGFDLLEAEDGQQAIDVLQSTSVDVVLMDCQMPVLDGYSATEAIRSGAADTQTASNKEIPIIAMTANAIGGDKEKCLACGMNDYLSKPIEDEELNRVLLKYINPHD